MQVLIVWFLDSTTRRHVCFHTNDLPQPHQALLAITRNRFEILLPLLLIDYAIQRRTT